MGRDWIEFNEIQANSEVRPVLIRYYNVEVVRKTGDKSCRICTDVEHGHYLDVAHSYTEVLEKIRKAEEAQPYPVVERFTKEEYDYIRCKLEEVPSSSTQRRILKELEEILKEDK